MFWKDERLAEGAGARIKEVGEWAAGVRVRGVAEKEWELGVVVDRLES